MSSVNLTSSRWGEERKRGREVLFPPAYRRCWNNLEARKFTVSVVTTIALVTTIGATPFLECRSISAYCRGLIRNAWLHFRLSRSGWSRERSRNACVRYDEGKKERKLIVELSVAIALGIKYFHGHRLTVSRSLSFPLFLSRARLYFLSPIKLESRDCSVT